MDAKKATKEPTKKSHGHHGHTKAHKGHSKAHEKTTAAAETTAP